MKIMINFLSGKIYCKNNKFLKKYVIKVMIFLYFNILNNEDIII